MICTVTFNPSLDYIVRVDDMRLGVINRTTYEQVLPGGKGINVSIVLGNLGHESWAFSPASRAQRSRAACARRVSMRTSSRSPRA